MGCFLACFGSSKDRKNRKQRHKVQHRSQRNAGYIAQSTVSLEQSSLETPIKPVEEVRDGKAEEQLGSGSEEGGKKGKVKEENLAKPRESQASSESSSSSYPPNHRYQNCRESDDEEEDEFDYDEESDLGDDEDDIEDYVGVDDGALQSSDRSIHGLGRVTEEEESNPIGSVRGVGDGNVLKPVENLAQWKAVKAKGSTPLKPQKENLSLEQEEPRLSSSFHRSSKEHSFSFSEEVSVDASLSNWLSSREATPVKKSSTFNACTPERSVSPASISMKMSPEDRPILGALTLEEINKFSASSLTSRRSPSRSPTPDEMPIIGTVGTYWNHESTTTKDSNSGASFKGIPNTTSKYREDKKVNWHSTPFEKRLERALNRGSEA
ncbi:hypothetical protein ES288_D11G153200v1 [Gossypium darwinii]|uniref:Protein JASON n=1 Tax=Gossypium darwinii TaxID=34276 RepID=A0A5D2AK22_GOSDA|nr:hypothetical protein ES288_D11G153200v1 [Gossypium darwinii]